MGEQERKEEKQPLLPAPFLAVCRLSWLRCLSGLRQSFCWHTSSGLCCAGVISKTKADKHE